MNELIKWLEAILIPAEWATNNEYLEGYRTAVKQILDKANELSRHEQEEPLAVFCHKHKYAIQADYCAGGQWRIILFSYGPTKEAHPIYADTYPECEAKARQYLMGLEDK